MVACLRNRRSLLSSNTSTLWFLITLTTTYINERCHGFDAVSIINIKSRRSSTSLNLGLPSNDIPKPCQIADDVHPVKRFLRPQAVVQNVLLPHVATAALLSLSLVFASPFPQPTAYAADYYGSMSEEQRAIAEAWRVVDNSFIDRTFNGQDWFQMRQNFVHKKYKNMDEARKAIDQMVNSLGDKYTRYLPPDKYQSIVDSATGTLAGIGVQISTNSNNKVIALDVEPNSPASKAGIKPQDVFVEVDGFNCASATPDEVASKIRGPEGSKVGIVMERQGKTLDFIITRQFIKVTSVKSYLSSPRKVGVIQIKSFSGTTADLVQEAWADLKKKGATAFLIDLRGNPGGLLTGGVDAASLFLDGNKPIVFTVNKNGELKFIVDFCSFFMKYPTEFS
jgi:carboxyl-terminal processing protease